MGGVWGEIMHFCIKFSLGYKMHSVKFATKL